MRMWMILPSLLCRQHLLGEHGEIHKHRHNFVKQHNMSGRIGQIFPRLMKVRHDALVREMIRRGMNHKSPYKMPDVEYLPENMLNEKPNYRYNFNDLHTRCPNCKKIFKEFAKNCLH